MIENVKMKKKYDDDGNVRKLEIAVDFPSGKMIIGNDFRKNVLQPGKDAGGEGLSHQTWIKVIAEFYGEQGMLHSFVGNTCPLIYQHNSEIVIGSPSCDNKSNNMHPVDWPIKGSITTDLWWFSIMDYDRYFNSGGSKEDIKHNTILHVEPGRYIMTYDFNSTRVIGINEPCIYAKIERSDRDIEKWRFPDEGFRERVIQMVVDRQILDDAYLNNSVCYIDDRGSEEDRRRQYESWVFYYKKAGKEIPKTITETRDQIVWPRYRIWGYISNCKGSTKITFTHWCDKIDVEDTLNSILDKFKLHEEVEMEEATWRAHSWPLTSDNDLKAYERFLVKKEGTNPWSTQTPPDYDCPEKRLFNLTLKNKLDHAKRLNAYPSDFSLTEIEKAKTVDALKKIKNAAKKVRECTREKKR